MPGSGAQKTRRLLTCKAPAGHPAATDSPLSERKEVKKPEAELRHKELPWERLLMEISRREPLAFVAPAFDGNVESSEPCRDHSAGVASSPSDVPLEELLIIIVPFRLRARHLRLMLSAVSNYLDAVLQHQQTEKQQHQQQGQHQQEGWPRGRTDYCFIVSEQQDSRPFHKGLLLNAACLWVAKQRPQASEDPLRNCAAASLNSNAIRTPTENREGSTREGAFEAATGRCGSDMRRLLAPLPAASAWEEPLEGSEGIFSEVKKKIRRARRVFVCLHDVDVVPKGRSFDAKHGGQPCAYLPSPPEGVVRHLYGELWALSMLVCLGLEDFARADGHDLRYEGWGFEDEDFCMRCTQAGLFIQRGPLASIGAGDGNKAAGPHADGLPRKREQCDSDCCSQIFSRRLCACAPFRELDVFSTDMLRSAMLLKLNSREGQRNRRLFCSLWLPNGDASIASSPDARNRNSSLKEGAVDKNLASDYGLRMTELLVLSGRLQLRIEPWPSSLVEGNIAEEEKRRQQKHQQATQSYSRPSLRAGLEIKARAEAASENGGDPRALTNSESSVGIAPSRSNSSASVEARESKPDERAASVSKEAKKEGPTKEELREQVEGSAFRRDLLAAYGSRLVWLNVSLCPDESGSSLAL